MFGIELADAAFLPAATVALLAGILSFLSPCVLPVVPPYLAYMTGVGVGGLKAGERSAVLPALLFVLGLSTVFLLMGIAASALGIAMLALAFGAILALAPHIGPLLATLIVVGVLLAIAAFAGWRAQRSYGDIRTALRRDLTSERSDD